MAFLAKSTQLLLDQVLKKSSSIRYLHIDLYNPMDIQGKVIKSRYFDEQGISSLTRVTFTGKQASCFFFVSAMHCNEIKITDLRAPNMNGLGLDFKSSCPQIDSLWAPKLDKISFRSFSRSCTDSDLPYLTHQIKTLSLYRFTGLLFKVSQLTYFRIRIAKNIEESIIQEFISLRCFSSQRLELWNTLESEISSKSSQWVSLNLYGWGNGQ
jgi:hypothetical protein